MTGWPTSSSPFPLLKLPREIRDSIYHYALLHPSPTGTGSAPSTCQIDSLRRSVKMYWGTERSTRLFRVSRQVFAEASEVFYSSFRFEFAPLVDARLVNTTFRDTLTARARNFVKALGFVFILKLSPHTFPDTVEERWRKTLEAAVGLFPKLKRGEAVIAIELAFIGSMMPEHQEYIMVNRTMRMLSPLKVVERVVFKERVRESAQRLRIIRKTQEGWRQWEFRKGEVL